MEIRIKNEWYEWHAGEFALLKLSKWNRFEIRRQFEIETDDNDVIVREELIDESRSFRGRWEKRRDEKDVVKDTVETLHCKVSGRRINKNRHRWTHARSSEWDGGGSYYLVRLDMLLKYCGLKQLGCGYYFGLVFFAIIINVVGWFWLYVRFGVVPWM